MCSETSAHKIQTPRNYQKVRIQHSEQVEILKSRIFIFIRSSSPPPPPTHGAPCAASSAEVLSASLIPATPSLYSKSIQISNCNSIRIFHLPPPFPPTHVIDKTCYSFHLTRLYHLNNRRIQYGVYLCNCLHPPVTFFMHPNILLSTSLWNVLNLCQFRKVRDPTFHTHITQKVRKLEVDFSFRLFVCCLLAGGLRQRIQLTANTKSHWEILFHVYRYDRSLT